MAVQAEKLNSVSYILRKVSDNEIQIEIEEVLSLFLLLLF